MPCSAEIEPPAAVTRSWTKAVTASPTESIQPGPAPSGARTLKWMLPSPRWPKADHCVPGKARLDRGGGLGHEAGHGLDRDRNVVLGGRPVLLLGFGDRVAQPPEALGLGLARGDHGVAHQPGLQRRAQPFVEQPLRARRRHRRHRLDQHVPRRRRGQRRARPRNVGEDEVEDALRHQLEALDRVAQRRLEMPEQLPARPAPSRPRPRRPPARRPRAPASGSPR